VLQCLMHNSWSF